MSTLFSHKACANLVMPSARCWSFSRSPSNFAKAKSSTVSLKWRLVKGIMYLTQVTFKTLRSLLLCGLFIQPYFNRKWWTLTPSSSEEAKNAKVICGKLSQVLKRVVNSNFMQPPISLSFLNSQRFDPIDFSSQYLTKISFFRDNSHFFSWEKVLFLMHSIWVCILSLIYRFQYYKLWKNTKRPLAH